MKKKINTKKILAGVLAGMFILSMAAGTIASIVLLFKS